MSKDSGVIEMVLRLASPPKLLLLNCGNMSNAALQGLFQTKLRDAIALLERADSIVEIG